MKTYWEIREAAMHPQANLTKMQRRALASPAARAKPKDQVTLPKMPWDKDKDKDKKKNEAYKEPQGQAKRLMSPLQKIRQDKEKADRDRDGKLKEGYEGEVSSHLKALDIDHHWKDGHLHVHKRDHKDVKKRLSDTDMEMPKIKVHEEKGRGPTGIAYSLPKGHPDAENPATRKKYPERQTPEYKKKFFGKQKTSASSHGMKESKVNEISKGMASRYLKKVPASAAHAGDLAGTGGMGQAGASDGVKKDYEKKRHKGIKQFIKRHTGTAMAVDKLTGKAKVPAK